LVCGTLGEKIAWHWGFGASGIGMLIGLATYLAGRRHLPPERARVRAHRVPLSRADWRRIAGIVLALVPYMLASAALNQAYGIMLVWADTGVAHDIGGWAVPITWVMTADGLFTILGIGVATSIWKRLAAHGREPHDIGKVAVACAGMMVGYLYLALAARQPLVPMAMFVGFYLIVDFAIGWLEAPTASLVSRDAPAQVNAMMMAVFKLAYGLCYFLLGWLGRFFEPLGPSNFWLLNAGLAAIGLAIIAIGGRRIVRMLEPERLAR
jgi:POT family proton-dependent oligopeptide transporter